MGLVQIMHNRIDKLIEGEEVDPIQPTDEMIKFYVDRTKKHIERVANNLRIVADTQEPLKDELIKRSKVHDANKFDEEFFIPYVWITWMHHEKDLGKPFQYPAGVEAIANEATKQHVLSNDHHVEYWAGEAPINVKDRDKADKAIDASKMPDEAVIEMVADWVAMSEEKKSNTAREWFMKQKDIRWKFTPHQEDLIDRILLVLEG